MYYLKGSVDLIRDRLEERKGHFAGIEILEGQFDALEEPENVLTEGVGSGSRIDRGGYYREA